ncbi:MAG: Nuclease [Candidatus Tokpelaia hoelldobleri]|uniref:Nuclease n=1 Tax=Candidatus Tokpelaia hoelldobleri TaxID=1902579 RepID=A0A1U9JV68_9HYPH|nr:MAG: Nuclease [Candidatus Tokpelaia hoelldoblerii]
MIAFSRDMLVAGVVIVLAGFLAWYGEEQANVAPLPAQVISGYGEILDGDTIRLQGKRIRLVGMDAPETEQYCRKDGQEFACGRLSTAHLARLVNNQPVHCKWLDYDKYNRILGSCFAGAQDLNQTMVFDGWAVSYDDYPKDERFARQQKRGMWQWDFERPHVWRRANLRQVSGEGIK